jgi:hypothetical protein
VKACVLLAALALVGCATPMAHVERRQDGILHFTCKSPLPECLAAVEKECQFQRYAVLRAFDDHDLKGDTAQPGDFRSSEAFVRCDRNTAWGDENRALRQHPIDAPSPASAPTSPPAVAAPTRACVPGAAQACVGPGGCAGGQVCAVDGASFGPCDCGPAKPASPP